MSRVEKIFQRVRRTLGDTRSPYRHSDDDFLILLNEALDDISVKTKLFRGSYDIHLSPGAVNYKLPEDLILLENVIYDGEDLPIKSVDYMNRKIGLDWRSKTSENKLECVVFDQEDVQYIQVYPRLVGEDFTQLFDATIYGVVADLVESDAIISSQSDTFGVLVEGSDQLSITVEYKRALPSLESKFDDLPLPYFYDIALKHYITGHILRDDRSEQNRQFGGEEINFYIAKVQEIIHNAVVDNTWSAQKDTYYNGIG